MRGKGSAEKATEKHKFETTNILNRRRRTMFYSSENKYSGASKLPLGHCVTTAPRHSLRDTPGHGKEEPTLRGVCAKEGDYW